TFEAFGNQLTGPIPSLQGLSNLQDFYVWSNQLSGTIPSLVGLTNLHTFIAFNNRLTGSIPSLQGLPNLINFSVSANQLTGGIPTLDGLALQNFYVGANNLTGDVPAAPASLIAGGSSLCDNPLNHTPDPAWDAATGNSPWYANCSFTSTTTTLGSSLNPSVAGQGVTFTATVAGQSPFGSVTFADGSNVLCNAVTLT